MSLIGQQLSKRLHRCDACGHEFRAYRIATRGKCPNCRRFVDLLDSEIEDDGRDLALARHKAALAARRRRRHG